MNTKFYTVLIQAEPSEGFQSFIGWDQVFTSPQAADAVRARAAQAFHAAKVTSATREEALELGWIPHAPPHD